MTRNTLLIVLVVCLSGCRPAAPPLSGGKPISHWLDALKDPNPQQRKTAVFKLGNVGPTNPAVGPALLEALKDGDAAVRREAILAWMKFGPGAQEAVPTLSELQQRDPDAQVRIYAAQALRKLTAHLADSPPAAALLLPRATMLAPIESGQSQLVVLVLVGVSAYPSCALSSLPPPSSGAIARSFPSPPWCEPLAGLSPQQSSRYT